MRKLPKVWPLLIWGILGFLMVLSGMTSGNVATVIVGAALAFAGASGYLTSRVESESRVKKALEAIFAIIATSIIVFGYVITGNLILGFLTCFMVVMLFIVFALSYLMPKLLS